MDAYLNGKKIATDKDIKSLKEVSDGLLKTTIPYNQALSNESLYDNRFKKSPQIRAYAGTAAATIQENPFKKGVWFIALFFVNQGGGNLIVIDTYNHIKLKALNGFTWDKEWTEVLTQIGGVLCKLKTAMQCTFKRLEVA